jgi:predicted hotdog family 3-hydroxylacyl-ACP dehydratase
MIVTQDFILDFIPQRFPFIMIDCLTKADHHGFESTFEIKPTNIFIENNILQEPSLIENIAQTCAAGFGYLQKNSNSAPSIGYIGSITKLIVHNLPIVGSIIKTRVQVLRQFENVYLIEGCTNLNNDRLLECEMKIVLA